MAKTKEALLEEAKELKVNVEGLDYHQLRTAVKTARDSAASQTPPEEGGKGSFKLDEPSTDQGESIEVNAANERFLDAQRAAKVKRDAQRKVLAKEAKKRERAKNSSKSKEEAGKKAGKDSRPVFTDDRGLKFRFTNTAPKTLNIDGRSRKVSEIIEDEETMLELVYGNSNFIEQIY